MKNDVDCVFRGVLYALPAAVALTALCAAYLDEPVAGAVGALIRSHPLLARHTARIPDLLLPSVLLFSAWTWFAYFRRARQGVRDDRSRFYRLAGSALPAAFLLKSALKYAFGRINTRVWIEQPTAHSFLWFGGSEDHSGFPSGHMTVFAALAAACWIFFPRARFACVPALSVLAAALVITGYHFVGDVVAGAYVGAATTAAACRLLEGRPASGR